MTHFKEYDLVVRDVGERRNAGQYQTEQKAFSAGVNLGIPFRVWHKWGVVNGSARRFRKANNCLF